MQRLYADNQARLLAIYHAKKAQEGQTNFHFSDFVSSPLANEKVLYDDLSFLIIDNGAPGCGVSDYHGPAVYVGDQPSFEHRNADYDVIGYSYVGAPSPFLYPHELSHTLALLTFMDRILIKN